MYFLVMGSLCHYTSCNTVARAGRSACFQWRMILLMAYLSWNYEEAVRMYIWFNISHVLLLMMILALPLFCISS